MRSVYSQTVWPWACWFWIRSFLREPLWRIWAELGRSSRRPHGHSLCSQARPPASTTLWWSSHTSSKVSHWVSFSLSQLFILFVVFNASPLCWRSVIIYSVCIFSSLPKKSDTVHWKAKFLHGSGIFCKLVCYPHRLIVDVIINHWYK